LEDEAMRQVGTMMQKFGSHATTVVDEEGHHWWFFHPVHMDLETASKTYQRNGPFDSQEEAEEHFRVTILGHDWPNRKRGLQRRKS
jgi:hypothetical protein